MATVGRAKAAELDGLGQVVCPSCESTIVNLDNIESHIEANSLLMTLSFLCLGRCGGEFEWKIRALRTSTLIRVA